DPRLPPALNVSLKTRNRATRAFGVNSRNQKNVPCVWAGPPPVCVTRVLLASSSANANIHIRCGPPVDPAPTSMLNTPDEVVDPRETPVQKRGCPIAFHSSRRIPVKDN